MGKRVASPTAKQRIRSSSESVSSAGTESLLDKKKQDTIQVKQLKNMLRALKASRRSSDKMLQQLKAEIEELKNDKAQDRALKEALSTIKKLQKEKASLQKELKKRDEITHKNLLQATENNEAVQSEVRRMKTKINKAVRQCGLLQQRNEKLKELVMLYKEQGVVVANSGGTHENAVARKPKVITSKSTIARKDAKTSAVVKPKKSTPLKNGKKAVPAAAVKSEEESEEDQGYSPQMARLMGNKAAEEEGEETAESSSSEEVGLAPQVDTRTPGWFIQESPAEAWRRRKAAEAAKGKSGTKQKPPKRTTSANLKTVEPGMKPKSGFTIPLPEQDAGIPEFMRKFQKIGMKGEEKVIETAGAIQTSKDVKVGRLGVQLSAMADGARKADEERLERERERLEREEEERKEREAEEEMAREAAEKREREILAAKIQEEREQAEAKERHAREEMEKAEKLLAEKLEAQKKAAETPAAAASEAPGPAASAPAPAPPAAPAPEPEPEQAPTSTGDTKKSFLESSDSDSSPLIKKAAAPAPPPAKKKKKSFLDDSSSDSSSGW